MTPSHTDTATPEISTQPTAQEQLIDRGLLIHQIRESIGPDTDPRSAIQQVIVLLAHQILQASGNQIAVRQIASDLQQHAEEIAEFCTKGS